MRCLYRYSTIGETLSGTLDELHEQYGVSLETCERIKTKFDQVG